MSHTASGSSTSTLAARRWRRAELGPAQAPSTPPTRGAPTADTYESDQHRNGAIPPSRWARWAGRSSLARWPRPASDRTSCRPGRPAARATPCAPRRGCGCARCRSARTRRPRSGRVCAPTAAQWRTVAAAPPRAATQTTSLACAARLSIHEASRSTGAAPTLRVEARRPEQVRLVERRDARRRARRQADRAAACEVEAVTLIAQLSCVVAAARAQPQVGALVGVTHGERRCGIGSGGVVRRAAGTVTVTLHPRSSVQPSCSELPAARTTPQTRSHRRVVRVRRVERARRCGRRSARR